MFADNRLLYAYLDTTTCLHYISDNFDVIIIDVKAISEWPQAKHYIKYPGWNKLFSVLTPQLGVYMEKT